MNNKRSFVCFVFLLVGSIALLTVDFAAQNKVSVKGQRSLSAGITSAQTLQTYIDISGQPMEKRQAIFSKQSAEEKAKLFKLHLALQFVKRPNLTGEQKDLILDSIPMIIPESYDTKNVGAGSRAEQGASVIEAKARTLFPMKDVFEIFAKLGGTDEDGRDLKKYQSLTASPFFADRRNVFGSFSPEEKSIVIKIHLAYQLATRPLLREQDDFILDTLNSVSPDFYKFDDGTPERIKVDEVLKQISSSVLIHFEKKEAFEIFVAFGAKSDLPRSSTDKNNPSTENQGGPLCSCSSNSDYCGWWSGSTHCEGDYTCTQRRTCGTLGGYLCNGYCWAN